MKSVRIALPVQYPLSRQSEHQTVAAATHTPGVNCREMFFSSLFHSKIKLSGCKVVADFLDLLILSSSHSECRIEQRRMITAIEPRNNEVTSATYTHTYVYTLISICVHTHVCACVHMPARNEVVGELRKRMR